MPTRRILFAAAVGNVIEWYDFGIYGLLAPVLATLFFPSEDHIAQLLGVYGGFAAGFAMRPLGAIVLGHLGDRVGRSFVLVLSIALIGASTVAVGLLPTYAAIGFGAPVMLVATRLFQGFSVGGEYVDSVTYLVENTRQRGAAGSLANFGATIGMLLAAAAATLVTAQAARHPDVAWIWRTPFLFGGVLALAGYLLRRHLPEHPARQRSQFDQLNSDAPAHTPQEKPQPLRQAIREVPTKMILVVLFTSGYGVMNYLTMVFLPTFAREFAHVAESQALRINTAGQALALFVIPLSGWISDRFLSRRTLIFLAMFATALFAWPGFALVLHTGAQGLWPAQLVMAALLSVVMGTAPAMLSEQFVAAYRVSAHAVTFNIGIGIVGGTAPLVAVALIRVTHNVMSAAAYLIVATALSAVSILFLEDRSRELEH